MFLFWFASEGPDSCRPQTSLHGDEAASGNCGCTGGTVPPPGGGPGNAADYCACGLRPRRPKLGTSHEGPGPVFSLQENAIGDEGASAVAIALKANTTLTAL